MVAPTVALTVDVTAVEPLDTMGALVIDGMIRDYERDGRRAELVGLSPHYRDLYGAVHASGVGMGRRPRQRDGGSPALSPRGSRSMSMASSPWSP